MQISKQIVGTKRIEVIKDTNNETYTARIYQDIDTAYESLWVSKTLKTQRGVEKWAESQVK